MRVSHFKGKKLGPRSPETRLKISIALKGKKLSKKHKLKIGISQKGKKLGTDNPMFGRRGKLNPNFGRKHTEDEKSLMSKMALGRKPWNYGKRGSKMPCYGRKGNLHPMFGKNITLEHKERISKAVSGKNNPMYGKPCYWNTKHCKWYRVGGIRCQGKYEKIFVESCLNWGLKVKRNEKFFEYEFFGRKRTYTPDFIIEGINGFIEVKGYFGPRSKVKFFACKNKGVEIRLVLKKELFEFQKTGILRFFVPDQSIAAY